MQKALTGKKKKKTSKNAENCVLDAVKFVLKRK